LGFKKSHILRQHFLAALLIFTCCFSAKDIFSQSRYTLTGKVLDAENNTPLLGVTVSTDPSGKAVNTDAEGNFFISLDAANPYTLTFTSVGYLPKQLTNIQYTGNDIPVLTIALDRNDKALEAVVVKGNVRKEAQASLYNMQRTSSSISDGISAELIRKSPDKNTGDVLKRVSGASVQDNKFVVIRGLSERYNASLLNNSVLPSTEADKKAFAFDIIPSSVIDNLVIYKSATPDLPGDFSGGAIKVSTKDYPARKISELTVSVGYNSMTTGKNFYKGYPNGKYDAVGILDNSRLMPGAYYTNRYGFASLSNESKNKVTKLFPNTFGFESAMKSMPNISANYTGGNTTVFKNGNKLGFLYSAGYSNSRAVSFRERSDYDIYDAEKRVLYDYKTDNYDEKNNLSGLLNLTYSYGRSKISIKNLFNNNFSKTTQIRNGANYEVDKDHFFYIKSDNSEVTVQGLANSVVEGLHKVGKDWTIDWNGSFAYTYKNQPDQRILTFRSPENTDGNYYIKLNNENSPEIRNAGRVYSFLNEKIYGASGNVAKQFKMFDQQQKLKFGTMNYYRMRNVEVDALGYSTLNPYGKQINESKNSTFNTLFSQENIDAYQLTVANIESNSAQYDGNAMLNTGYVMLDNKFSEKIKFTWGVRVEKYRQELSARNKATKVYDNTDVLPSFLFTYALNDQTNLRLAGSQAVNRPEFRELADYSIYDYDNYIVVRGNPELVRAKNNNADIRYEWFPAVGEIISASVFYKHFENPIEQTNLGNDVFSYANANSAEAYGAEIELRKKLGFISSGFFDNLTVYANGAYIKGSVKFDGLDYNSPLQGQSPYLVNAGLNYSTKGDGLSMNLLYNRIGPRLRSRARGGAGLNIFEKPRDVLDFQISKKLFSNRIDAKLTISDLFAQPVIWYYKYDVNPTNTNFKASTDKVINSIKYGSTATLSLRYSFGKK
jgi:TonB-dependent receptor